MATSNSITEKLQGMIIEDEEDEKLIFDEEIIEDANKFELCLVGRFLTEKNINTRSMKSKLADVWRPARGINIKDLKPGLFLFQFYHDDDLYRVLNGGPWTFDNMMLVLSTIPKGEDPINVPLLHLNFWIQLYGLPSGFMTEKVGKQLGDFFGSFIMYDPNNNSSIWRESMRLKISVDVTKPLKRKKKICKRDGSESIVQCKYERLGDFCFVCGMLTHTERFCPLYVLKQSQDSPNDWGGWLRAPPRRAPGHERSKWLRDEKDVDWCDKLGKDNYYLQFSSGYGNKLSKEHNQERVYRGGQFVKDFPPENSSVEAANQNSISPIGPPNDELIGLNVDARKRSRSDPSNTKLMDLDGKLNSSHPEAVLSFVDCAGSSQHVLATSAKQTSQSS